MGIDQADFTWEATPYSNTGPSPAASRRSAWTGQTVTVVRATALLAIAALAILVLLPAAIAAQAGFAV